MKRLYKGNSILDKHGEKVKDVFPNHSDIPALTAEEMSEAVDELRKVAMEKDSTANETSKAVD